MNAYKICIIFALASALNLHAQEGEFDENGNPIVTVSVANYTPSRMIELRPTDKTPLMTKTNERNPYARRSAIDEARENGEENQEEIQIRQKLSYLSVKGRSVGPNGPKVLLGDIILEKGRELPPLLQGQVETLKVMEVSDSSIILGWLDLETGEFTGKTMQVAYDLTPRINYKLHGQPALAGNGDEDTAPVYGIMRTRERSQGSPDVSGHASNTHPDE